MKFMLLQLREQRQSTFKQDPDLQIIVPMRTAGSHLHHKNLQITHGRMPYNLKFLLITHNQDSLN